MDRDKMLKVAEAVEYEAIRRLRYWHDLHVQDDQDILVAAAAFACAKSLREAVNGTA